METGSKEWWEREAKLFESEAKNARNRCVELEHITQEMAYAIEKVGDFGEGTRVAVALSAWFEWERKENERIKAIVAAFGYGEEDI